MKTHTPKKINIYRKRRQGKELIGFADIIQYNDKAVTYDIIGRNIVSVSREYFDNCIDVGTIEIIK